MLIISHLGIPLAFIFLTTVLRPLWFVSFLSGQSSRKGDFSFHFFMIAFMLSLPIGCLLYHVRPDGFFIACKYTGPLLIISEGLLDMNKRKISTGHREPPVLNILGFCRRGLAFNPCPDALVTPSLKVINSIPLLSFAKQKSSNFI